MKITPLEIRKHPFKKVRWGGVNEDQVHNLLNQVASELEELRLENGILSAKIKEQDNSLLRYHNIEETLSDTLLTAQRATDDAKANAQKEAELIVKEAQVRADAYENGVSAKVRELEAEIRSLEVQKESFLQRFRTLLSDQLSFLDVMSKNEKIEDSKK